MWYFSKVCLDSRVQEEEVEEAPWSPAESGENRVNFSTKRCWAGPDLRRFLTTVQQSGQNHHMNSRASRRKSTSRVMRRMVPSNCTGTQTPEIKIHWPNSARYNQTERFYQKWFLFESLFQNWNAYFTWNYFLCEEMKHKVGNISLLTISKGSN